MLPPRSAPNPPMSDDHPLHAFAQPPAPTPASPPRPSIASATPSLAAQRSSSVVVVAASGARGEAAIVLSASTR